MTKCAALKQFAGTKKITNVDAVLATVPAPARAILMAKFDTDNGTVLTADGQEAKRGALFLVTEVLPKRAQRVLRTNPHCPEMSFTDRENMSKHVTQALFATKAAIWTFVQTPRGTKPLKSWDDWIQHANNTPVTWAEDTANAIDLFVSVVTATHGYGAQATGPADADATKADDDDKSKSLLIGTTHNQMITYEMNWSWLGPWMEAFTSLSTTVRNSTVTANERKVVVTPDMIMGATDKILRILVDAFVAAVANGQRYGTPVEYEQLTKQHYTGEGEGLHASIMRFKTASNPLMRDIMQDMFRSVLEGSKQAHLQQATPAAAQAGSGRRQTQQQQQQAAAPLQAQLLHAQQQLQLQQQQRQQPPPATSPAPAPAAASPARAEPPAWLMQPPPWWAVVAAHAAGRKRPRPTDAAATARPATQQPAQPAPTPRRPSFQGGHAAAGPAAEAAATAPATGHGHRVRQATVRGEREVCSNVPPLRQPVRRQTARRDVESLRRRQRPHEADGQGNLPPGDERPTKGDRHEGRLRQVDHNRPVQATRLPRRSPRLGQGVGRTVADSSMPRAGGHGGSPAGLGAMTGAGGSRRQWAPRATTPTTNAH